MATRTHAREMVIELLYAYSLGNDNIFKFVDELMKNRKIRNAQADFAKGLFNGVIENLSTIDKAIKSTLKSWDFDRLGIIDKCILRLGVYEILYSNTDTPIIINEAIEISKILGDDNTPKFINGVLDAVNKNASNKDKNEQN
ncbi:transcription antitermination factor NusB [Helicobacter sp. MIT 14-3879]|uniref:transcription antitermination factor NusB n=1 Tax=Helicobacter sp. MIT 14-3879 TaxID=2040649 RepID=UPI000E1EED2D|nr:transcription antitermination factor NusB [Helicobacter sp. MIT 14-3879]RDU62888.1 transcription antitermination factor NusB [Helicobacter sp. MIT 14-3879]